MSGRGHEATVASDWETLRAIAQWLRPCFAVQQVEFMAPPQEWEAIVGIASRHMVAPALGWAWLERRDLPPEVARVFGGLLAMNRERNLALMTGLGALLAALNREGIVPVLLKGSAMLADRTYPDPGMRVVLDCDLLLAEPDLERASRILKAEGYAPCGTARTQPGHHHLPALKNFENGLVVELHRRPIDRRWDGIVDSQGCFARAVAVEVGPGQALIPHIDDRVAHNIAHTQLTDERYRSGFPHLRQLLDVAAFRQRHEGTIDWQAIADRFRRARRLHVLTDNLALAEVLFAQAAPPELACSTAKAERRVRSALSRAPLLRAIKAVQWTMTDALRLVAAEPRYLGLWIANARGRGSVIGGIRRRASAG